MKNNIDEKFMRVALKEAVKASLLDEVPVGAVIVLDGKIIAKAHNKRELTNDPLGHAELIVIRKASKKLETWRLTECDIYVTLEPCAMCAGAIMWSRFKRVIFGAYDEKGGALGSSFNLFEQNKINHKPDITSGVLLEESKLLLQTFFKNKRIK